MNSSYQYPDVFTSSEEYAKRFAGDLGAWLVNRQNEIVGEFLAKLNPDSILDVAGGHGHIANAFSAKYKVTVLGSTSDCSKQIKSEAVNSGCVFEAGNVENLKYNENSFDVVTCIRYLSHTDNWQHVIRELCRVARKAVIIDFPPLLSFNALTPLLYQLKKKIEGNTRTYTVFRKSVINREFVKNNFMLYLYRAQFFVPMVLHRLLQNPSFSEGLEILPAITGLTDLAGSPALACFIKRDSSV